MFFSILGQHSEMYWGLDTQKCNEFEVNQMLLALRNQGYSDLQLIHRRKLSEYLQAYYKWVKGLSI